MKAKQRYTLLAVVLTLLSGLAIAAYWGWKEARTWGYYPKTIVGSPLDRALGGKANDILRCRNFCMGGDAKPEVVAQQLLAALPRGTPLQEIQTFISQSIESPNLKPKREGQEDVIRVRVYTEGSMFGYNWIDLCFVLFGGEVLETIRVEHGTCCL